MWGGGAVKDIPDPRELGGKGASPTEEKGGGVGGRGGGPTREPSGIFFHLLVPARAWEPGATP